MTRSRCARDRDRIAVAPRGAGRATHVDATADEPIAGRLRCQSLVEPLGPVDVGHGMMWTSRFMPSRRMLTSLVTLGTSFALKALRLP
jgi:hypothetical protein